MTRARSGKDIKKPQKDSTQDCVLISISTANSRKRQKKRQATREIVRQYRARQAEINKSEKTKEVKETSKCTKKNYSCH